MPRAARTQSRGGSGGTAVVRAAMRTSGSWAGRCSSREAALAIRRLSRTTCFRGTWCRRCGMRVERLLVAGWKNELGLSAAKGSGR